MEQHTATQNERAELIKNVIMSRKAVTKKVPVRAQYLSCDLKQIKRPISEEVLGFRLMFVIPNKARYNRLTGKYETSYHKKYLVHWDGDFNEGNRFTVERFSDFLKAHNLDINRIKGDSDTMRTIIEYVKSRM